jgi:hypothetical protein
VVRLGPDMQIPGGIVIYPRGAGILKPFNRRPTACAFTNIAFAR